MIKSLYIRDFRNYTDAKVSFSPSINVIWGENAQGKTNLLEAIFLFITGRSFRTSHLEELIRFGKAAFHLEILFEKNGIEQTLSFSFEEGERKVLYNGNSLSSLSALLGILNGVVLSPDDRSLVKGSPSTRRQFLDLLLSQAKPLYLHHLSRYLRAMKQRNTLLKKRSLETIAVWEEQMALAASYLTLMRSQTVTELQTLSQAETLGSEILELEYRSQALTSVEEEPESLKHYFIQQFVKQRRRECELGITLSGPHRDDFLIALQNKDARQFASEGQQRSCVASLKLAQWKWLKRLADQPPLLCIDDIGVSFDHKREEAFYRRIQDLGQVFVTSARPLPFDGHSISVQNGNLIF